MKQVARLRGKGQQCVQAHVGEAHSPERVAGVADKMRTIPGLATDLTARDEHGNPRGFNALAARAKAEKIVKSKAAATLVARPMRAPFSRSQAAGAKRTGPENMNGMPGY